MTKYAIYSDIHGNLEAYRSFLELCQRERVRQFFCVGDIVGYGADPSECIKLTREIDPVIVSGNHDWAAAGRISTEEFSVHAKSAVEWAAARLDEAEKQYLRSLDLTYARDDLTLVHSALARPEVFEYVFDYQAAGRMFRLMSGDIAFIGHSHVPGTFIRSGQKIDYISGANITLEKDKKYLINVGSVGQPRDGDWRGSFCLWDLDSGAIEIVRFDYDKEKAKDKILRTDMASFFAARLTEGR